MKEDSLHGRRREHLSSAVQLLPRGKGSIQLPATIKSKMAPQALTAANLSKLPKAQRTDQLLKLAQMKIDADEDASFLLEKVQQELAASSGRPGTRLTEAAADRWRPFDRRLAAGSHRRFDPLPSKRVP